ncbi:hypothetical protein HYR99_06325 [Candidatus Poribacteria bacterium]|nr:hypothetical protein [Candidatus Poribacteria bacterium]
MKQDRFIMFVADCFKHPETGYLVSGPVLSGQLEIAELGKNLYFLSEKGTEIEVTLAGLVTQRFKDMGRIERREFSLHVYLSQDELDMEQFKDGFLVDEKVGLQLVTFEGNIQLDTNQWEANLPYPATLQCDVKKYKGILRIGNSMGGDGSVPSKVQFVSPKPVMVSIPELRIEWNGHHFVMTQIKFKQNVGRVSVKPTTEGLLM